MYELNLFTEVAEGDLEMIKWLISQGLDPEEKNSEGLTPLNLAAQAGRWDILRALQPNYFDKLRSFFRRILGTGEF